MSSGRLGRPNRATPARARAEADALAEAGDVAGLRRLGLSLPALLAFTYERRRATALALALEGKLEGALAELALGRAAMGVSPERAAEDAALLRRLAHGEPPPPARGLEWRALSAITAVAATIALTVGLTVRLIEVDAPRAVIEAPPEQADAFVRVAPRPASRVEARPTPDSAARRGSATGFSEASAGAGSETPGPQRARPAAAPPRPASVRPSRPTAPTPVPPTPPQTPTAPEAPAAPAVPAAPAPAAQPTAAAPPSQAATPTQPPPAPRKPGRRRDHEKPPKPEKPAKPAKPGKKAEQAPPAAVPTSLPAEQPAPAAPPEPAAGEGHGPPPHANNDKDKEKEPKDKP